MRAHAEKVAGKGGGAGDLFSIYVVLAVVLCAAANVLEGVKTGSRGSVGVDVENLASLDILEKSHRRVTSIVLHHLGVVLTGAHVMGRVLEDTALAISALGGMLKEVLTDRRQVLSAETLLLHELILAVGEATALLLLAILAILALEPEAAELSLDLFLPAVLKTLRASGAYRHVRLLVGHAVNGRLEAIEAVKVIGVMALAVTHRGGMSALGLG